MAYTTLGLGGGGSMFCPAVMPGNTSVMFVNCDMGGFYRSADGGLTWQMIDGHIVRADTRCQVAFHPDGVTAYILHAPTSTKNREQQRDPEMHQTKKGKQWYFGMKAHVGVDSKTKIIHTAVATAANVADSVVLPDLLHGEETRVWGDQAYRGQTEVIRECAPQAQDCTHRRYRYKDRIDEVERAKNRTKSTVRSKVEHVFAVMKLKFGFVKLRYRGLKKNATQLFAVCALVNLYLLRKKLLLLAPA